MKKAVFITNPTAPGTSYENGWRRERSINTREQQLGRGEGLSIFRCEFDTPARMMSAVVRATALGIFDLFVNGMRVGVQMDDGFRYDELKPEWTDYHHRIFDKFRRIPDCKTRFQRYSCLCLRPDSGFCHQTRKKIYQRFSMYVYFPDNSCALTIGFCFFCSFDCNGRYRWCGSETSRKRNWCCERFCRQERRKLI